MGNLVLKGGSLSVPQSMMDKLMAVSKQAVVKSVGGSYFPRISPARRRFSIVESGLEPEVITGADGKPVDHIDVVILGTNPGEYKTYYADSYDPKAKEKGAPVCFSNNGIAPHPAAKQPQSDKCASCRQNVFGSKITEQGKKSKACSMSKRLLVVSADDLQGPIYMLNASYMALPGFNAMVGELLAGGLPLPAVVVRVALDDNVDVPVFTFNPIAVLDEKDLGIVAARLDEQNVKEFVEGTFDAESNAPRNVGAEEEAKPEPAPAPAPEPKAEEKPRRGFGAAKAEPELVKEAPLAASGGAPDVSDLMDF
ncbi:MAG: hypothetical protein K0041_05190 [Acidithiobacillus sp.]|nr:hypothetical protein [Acidithiobacillus sp.]